MRKPFIAVTGIGIIVACVWLPVTYGVDLLAAATQSSGAVEMQAQQLNKAADNAEGADAASVAQTLAKYRTAVPPTRNLQELLDALQETADAASVSWVSASPGRTPKDGPLTSYQLAASVSGTPSQVQTWLDELRTMERLVSIDAVSLQQADDGVTATISARFFVDPGSTGTGESP